MLAISLWQPWASLWVSGRKVHETRHWRTSYRGWLIVHAGKRFDEAPSSGDPLCRLLIAEFGPNWATDLPRGALVGLVHLVDCVPTRSLVGDVAFTEDDSLCGDFSEGRYAWRANDFRKLQRPMAYRGAQGFFRIAPNIFSAANIDPPIRIPGPVATKDIDTISLNLRPT
jgi:hypothetical protein